MNGELAGLVAFPTAREIEVRGGGDVPVIGRPGRLCGGQVVEVPGREAAAAEQLPGFPGNVLPGDDAVVVGQHAAGGPAHVAPAALEGEEADRLAVVFQDADLDAAADRRDGLGELGPEIGA